MRIRKWSRRWKGATETGFCFCKWLGTFRKLGLLSHARHCASFRLFAQRQIRLSHGGAGEKGLTRLAGESIIHRPHCTRRSRSLTSLVYLFIFNNRPGVKRIKRFLSLFLSIGVIQFLAKRGRIAGIAADVSKKKKKRARKPRRAREFFTARRPSER